MKADLHLHTRHSDGTETPAELLARAAGFRFDVIAVTDHDTVGGVAGALEEGGRLGVRVIPGVEITAHFHQQELHLLAYFHSDSPEGQGWRHPDLTAQLERDARHRATRAEEIVRRLNALGVAITMEQVLRASARGGKAISVTLGRPHLAAALMAAGHVSSLDEAFSLYLKRGRPAWVDKERAGAGDIIRLVHQCGGIISLAHPGLLRDGKIPERLLEEGLDAVEVYHSRHHSAQSTRYRRWAEEHGLLVTAGSDCHGMLKGEPLMGGIELRDRDLEKFLERIH